MKNKYYLGFYRDNAFNFDEFKCLDYILKSSRDLLNELADTAYDNSTIESMRAYSKVPIQIIDASSACYNLGEFLGNHDVLTMTGLINRKNGLADRARAWEELPIKIKMLALDYSNLSILLISKKEMEFAKDEYHLEFNVVNFELYTSSGERLIHGTDYYFYQNKIYLLKFGTERWELRDKLLVVKNMIIDYNFVENSLGDSLKVFYNKNFTKTEYKDTLTAFTKAALGGPTVGNLNSSFSEDVSMDGIKVVDFKNAPPNKKIFWEKQDLTPFDFMVTIPIAFLKKVEKLEYIQTFFNNIKPAYTNFIFVPEMVQKDQLLMRYIKGSEHKKATNYHTDKLTTFKDSIKVGEDSSTTFIDNIPHKSILRGTLDIDFFDRMKPGRDFVKVGELDQELNGQNSYDNIKSKETINKKVGEVSFVEKVAKTTETVEVITFDSNVKFDKSPTPAKFDTAITNKSNNALVDKIRLELIPKTKIDHSILNIIDDKGFLYKNYLKAEEKIVENKEPVKEKPKKPEGREKYVSKYERSKRNL